MLRVKNQSLQSFEIYFMTDSGAEPFWMTPNKSVVVEDAWVTEQIRTMQRRRLLEISKVG